jgi:hypothetical protein
VVEQFEAITGAKPQTELTEPTSRQALARRQANVLVVEPLEDLANPCPIVRVPLEVPVVALREAPVRRTVDVIDGPPDR